MATKTISIMEDVYKMLIRQKKKKESFSDLIRTLVKKKSDIMECAGLWSDLSEKQIKEMKESIKELKKKATKSLLEK